MAKSDATRETYDKVFRQFMKRYPNIETQEDFQAAALEFLTEAALNFSTHTFWKRKAALQDATEGVIIKARREGRHEDMESARHSLRWLKTHVPTFGTMRKGHGYGQYNSQTNRDRRKKIPLETILAIYAEAKPRERALIQLLYCTGIRTAEIIRGARIVSIENIIEVHITGAKKTKNSGNDRVIAIKKARLAKIFGEVWLDTYENTADMYNASETLQYQFRVTRKRAGIKRKITPYCMRHQFRSNLAASKPPGVVAAAMGHLSLRSQEQYGSRRCGGSPMPVAEVRAPQRKQPKREPKPTDYDDFSR